MSEFVVRSGAGRRSSAWLRRGVTLAATSALVAGFVTATTGTAHAAVPEFPDNVVVFPDRDFITLEGYQDYIGQDALVEVNRQGVGVVGSAIGKIGEGDVAFEINHPGGYCWGAGTNLKVTPDIQGGDVVSIKINGVNRGETTVSNARVTGTEYTAGSSTLVVNGVLGPEFSDANRLRQLEQRIVNPDLKDTAVNRRDVRAVTGGLTPAPKGGYLSNLETSGTSTFKATYQFDTADLAKTAATGGGERMMSWQFEDADANRQGLTIAELGEAGGPGMGGCPNGPLSSGPVVPSNHVATPVAGGYKVTWDPAVAVAGTPAITGYYVTALGPVVNGEQVTVGKRISGQAAKTTTINVDRALDWTFEIASVSSAGISFPAAQFAPAVVDTEPPKVTASPAGGSYNTDQKVSLESTEAKTDIYYTLGADVYPLEAGSDTPSVAAIQYEGAPISVTNGSVLRYVGFDLSGNVSETATEEYFVTTVAPPVAPANASVTPSSTSPTITWDTDPSAATYVVSTTSSTGGAVVPADVTVKAGESPSVSLTGLTAGATYTFTITAFNSAGGKTATVLPAYTTPAPTFVANAGADFSAKRGTTVTLDGSASVGARFVWTQIPVGSATSVPAADKVTIQNAGTKNASFGYPLYTRGMSDSLGFRLTVTAADGSTKTDDVLVSSINDRVTVSQARFKTGDFRLGGSATTVGSTVTIRNATTHAVIGTAQVTAAVAPATGGAWELRLRTNVANPGRVYAESSQGGVSTVFTVTT